MKHRFTIPGRRRCSITYLNGKYTGQDRTGDTDRPTIGFEFEEGLRLEEELRDDEISAAVDFLLQVDQIVLVRFRVRMPLRIAYEEARGTSHHFYLEAADAVYRRRK